MKSKREISVEGKISEKKPLPSRECFEVVCQGWGPTVFNSGHEILLLLMLKGNSDSRMWFNDSDERKGRDPGKRSIIKWRNDETNWKGVL